MLIDPKAGDVIKGRGEGELNINLNRKGELKITGDYTIDEGDYLFTLGNILNKRFDVESGGKITFNGDVENAEIDLKASYKNLKTSLSPILGEEYSDRVSVEPQLKLTGNLFNPLVAFDIYLPNADEKTRAFLQNAISTDEEVSRQFLFPSCNEQLLSRHRDPRCISFGDGKHVRNGLKPAEQLAVTDQQRL